ncbi:MAG: hypothetical protein RLY30_562 [Pseudomonadota bacterium]
MGTSLYFLVPTLLLVIAVLAVALKFGIRRAGQTDRGRMLLSVREIRTQTQLLISRVKRVIGTERDPYQVPWTVVLSESGPDPLGSASSALAYQTQGTESPVGRTHEGMQWAIYQKGVLVSFDRASLGEQVSRTEDARWDAFLGELGRVRSRRPLDSMVVAVPIQALIGQDNGHLSQVEAMATRLGERIWLAQNRYALRLAVYVVITGLDELPGGEALHHLPKHLQESILGWSSPHDLTQRFEPHWVDEALGQLGRDLHGLCTELCAAFPDQSTSPALLLSQRLSEANEATHVFCDRLMQSGGVHEPFFFRGVYWIGSGDRPLFTQHLLEQKIFGEFGLTRTASALRLARPVQSRVLRGLAWTALCIWTLGIGLTLFQMSRILPVLASGIDGLNRDALLRQSASQTATLDYAWRERTALTLIQGLEELSSSRVSALRDGTVLSFVPGSWPVFDNLLERTQHRIQREFQEVAADTIRRAIYRNTALITGVQTDPLSGELVFVAGECKPLPSQESPTKLTSPAIDRQPAYLHFKQLLSQLQSLDKAVGAYARLKTAARPSEEDFRRVAEFAFARTFDSDLVASTRLFKASLMSGQLDLQQTTLSAAAQCAAQAVHHQLLIQLVAQNPVLQSEREIQAAQRHLETLVDEGMDSSEILAGFRSLIVQLHAQRALLAEGGSTWMSGPQPNLELALAPQLESIRQNKLIGPALADRFRDEQRSANGQLLVRISETRAASGDPGLHFPTKAEEVQLSPERVAETKALEVLMALPFMTEANESPMRAPVAGAIVTWDIPSLERAVSLSSRRRQYLAEEFPKLPGRMRDLVLKELNLQVGMKIDDALERSYQTAGDHRLMQEQTSIGAYNTSIDLLTKLIADLREMNQPETVRQLDRVIQSDAQARLDRLGEQAEALGLFDLSSRGAQSLTGVNDQSLLGMDEAGVSDYFIQQTAQIEDLVLLAKAYQRALSQTSQRMQSDWAATLRDLDKYKAKDPRSSLAALEQFALLMSKPEDAAGCGGRLQTVRPPKRPVNLFDRRLRDLHQDLSLRCAMRDLEGFTQVWKRFAPGYNTHVAGRRPFTPYSPTARSADVSELGRLVQLLPRMPQLRADPTAVNPEVLKSIQRFGTQWTDIRSLLLPLFPADPAVAGGLDLQVTLRDHLDREKHGNKVIEWFFGTGRMNTRQTGLTAKPLRWKIGDPVRISLRFADQSPLVPVASAAQPWLSVQGRTASIRLDGPWAALDLINLLRSPEVSAESGGGQALEIRIPMAAAGQPGSGVTDEAVVYVTLSVSEPGKTTPLRWPSSFPGKLPETLTPSTGP